VHQPGQVRRSLRVLGTAHRREDRPDLVEFDAPAQQHEAEHQPGQAGVAVVVGVEEGDVEVRPGRTGRHRRRRVHGLREA
jgi:hypothetical protein